MGCNLKVAARCNSHVLCPSLALKPQAKSQLSSETVNLLEIGQTALGIQLYVRSGRLFDPFGNRGFGFRKKRCLCNMTS